jgi:hypothetical protein
MSRGLIPAAAVAALLFVPEATAIFTLVFEHLRTILNTAPPLPTVLQGWSSTPRAMRMVPTKTTTASSTSLRPARAASTPSAVSASPSAEPLTSLVDASGTLYIDDTGNAPIVEVAPKGLLGSSRWAV